MKWPRHIPVKYVRDNIWDEILPEHLARIAWHARIENGYDEDDKWTTAWETQDFTPRIFIREIGNRILIGLFSLTINIGPGHWAWCPDLTNDNLTRQFEAIASQVLQLTCN